MALFTVQQINSSITFIAIATFELAAVVLLGANMIFKLKVWITTSPYMIGSTVHTTSVVYSIHTYLVGSMVHVG